MKPILILLGYLFITSYAIGQSTQVVIPLKESLPVRTTSQAKKNDVSKVDVYICDSKTAYAYHADQGCSGLNRCTHAVVALTQREAEEKGRKACQKCH